MQAGLASASLLIVQQPCGLDRLSNFRRRNSRTALEFIHTDKEKLRPFLGCGVYGLAVIIVPSGGPIDLNVLKEEYLYAVIGYPHLTYKECGMYIRFIY